MNTMNIIQLAYKYYIMDLINNVFNHHYTKIEFLQCG